MTIQFIRIFVNKYVFFLGIERHSEPIYGVNTPTKSHKRHSRQSSYFQVSCQYIIICLQKNVYKNLFTKFLFTF